MIFWHRDPWIMHPNLLLCRSQTPLGTLPLPPQLPPPFSFFYPHYSSSSELSLIPPPSLPPSLSLSSPLPPTPPSNRKQHRVRLLFTSSRYRCLLSGSGQTLLMHLHNHEGGIRTLVSLFSPHKGERKYQRMIKKKRWDFIVSEEVFSFETSSRYLQQQAGKEEKEEEFQPFHFRNVSAPQTSPARHCEPTMALLLTLLQNKAPVVAGHGCGHLEWMMSAAARVAALQFRLHIHPELYWAVHHPAAAVKHHLNSPPPSLGAAGETGAIPKRPRLVRFDIVHLSQQSTVQTV